MGIDSAAQERPLQRHARFELAGPRRFLLPAVLLLIAEEPRHGYSIAKELQQMRLGRVDRPSVYRVLAELEHDGLVESFAENPPAGQERRSYRITAAGEQVLRRWMGVIKDERDGLERVLRRYVATESVEARVAEVAGGWQRVVTPVFSAVSPSSRSDHVITSAEDRQRSRTSSSGMTGAGSIARYDVDPERSVVLIDARSSVGPITFGALGLTGWVEVRTVDGHAVADRATRARLEIALDGLRSGNGLYDAELLRRVEARRYPIVNLELDDCRPIGDSNRYRVRGDVDFHGATRPLEGSVALDQPTADTLVVSGEQVIDIRDFGIASPSVLMLRIYPDVQVKLQIEARLCT